jgi:hypothetical protein
LSQSIVLDDHSFAPLSAATPETFAQAMLGKKVHFPDVVEHVDVLAARGGGFAIFGGPFDPRVMALDVVVDT